MKYEEFHGLLEKLHKLGDVAFLISYTDPRDGDLLPINNDDNLARALQNARPLLRIIIQRKGNTIAIKLLMLGHSYNNSKSPFY